MPAITLPPEEAVYQVIFVPVTVISETNGFVALQKLCAAVPAGVDGVAFTVTATASRDRDSQPFNVWLA